MIVLSTYQGLTETISSIPVRLSGMEASIAKHIGKQRNSVNVQDGVRDRRTVQGMDPEEMHIMAAGAELAACKVLNAFPDLTVLSGKQQRPVWDAVWEGRTVDIKHTQYAHGGLAVAAIKADKRADIYVLVTGKLPNYVVVGWCEAEDLFQPSSYRTDWSVPGYYLPHEQLRPFGVLNV